MRTVIILVIGLLGLAALAYTSSSPADCARELSLCVKDPPLFVKLTGASVNGYCETGFRTCQGRTGVNAEKSGAFAAARREAANAGHSDASPATATGLMSLYRQTDSTPHARLGVTPLSPDSAGSGI